MERLFRAGGGNLRTVAVEDTALKRQGGVSMEEAHDMCIHPPLCEGDVALVASMVESSCEAHVAMIEGCVSGRWHR
jgi:hypothetical protein